MSYGGGKRGELTSGCKRGLIILLEGPLTRINNGWVAASGKFVRWETIEALYDRYLIKIVVESRHRRRQTAKLTEVGEFAAREIDRQSSLTAAPAAANRISEAAARFIVEVVS